MNRRIHAVMVCAKVAMLGLVGCGGGDDPSAEAGLGEPVVVSGQYVHRTPPGANGGPAVFDAAPSSVQVIAGQKASVSGRVPLKTAAMLIGSTTGAGYFIVPTGQLDTDDVTLRSFAASLSFSRALAPGTVTVEARAVDEAGLIGPPAPIDFTVIDSAPIEPLTVALDWDSDADLDLHVVMPNPSAAPGSSQSTIEVWSERRSSFVSGAGVPVASSPYLDFDSNAQCVIDGRRQENVIFPVNPVPGTYTVRVDTASLCKETSARWHVRVLRQGELIGEALGVATAFDGASVQGGAGATPAPGSQGAGVTALVFTWSP